jgi:para-nitrobenzyl esterase
VLDASHFGKHCPQSPPIDDPNASEACLFLNVYVPRPPQTVTAPKRRPVMVWIHGGSHASGASEFYDPTPLLDTGGVIVVTLNYRLGPEHAQVLDAVCCLGQPELSGHPELAARIQRAGAAAGRPDTND